MIVTRKIDSKPITSALKAGLTIYESLCLGTQKSIHYKFTLTGVHINLGYLSRFIFREKYELFDWTNETVHYTCMQVSILSRCA